MSELGASLSPFQREFSPVYRDLAHLPKKKVRIFAVISSLISLIIFASGALDPPIPLRFIVVGFGPIFAFFAITSLFYLRSHESLSKDPLIVQIISFALVFGIAAALISLTLNTSTSLIINSLLISLGFNVDLQTLFLLFFAIIVPIIEEAAKAVPIFILSRSLRKEWGEQEKRVFSSSGIILFVAVLVGATFTLLETYLYIFNSISFEILEDDGLFNGAFLQLFVRFTFPLHIGTSVLMGLGLMLVLGKSRHRTPLLIEYAPFFFAFFVAVFAHGLWNGSLVASSFNPLPLINFLGEPFPLVTFILGLIVTSFIIIAFLFFPNIQLIPCKVCGNSHFPPFTHEAHYDVPFPSIGILSYEVKFAKPSLRGVINELKRGTYTHQKSIGQKIKDLINAGEYEAALNEVLPECIQCGARVGKNGVCSYCRSTPMFLCENCNYPIPVYAQECWKCSKKVLAPFSRTMKIPEKLINNISIGLGTFSAVHFITLTFVLVGLFFALGAYESFFSYLFLYSALSICFVIGLFWVNGSANRGAGIAFFRIIFALTLVDMTLTTFALTLLGILSPIRFGIPPLAFLVWLIFALIFVTMAFRILTETRIFIQQRTEDD